jgi:hypothetical protein
LELEALDTLLRALEVLLDACDGGVVVLGRGHLQQLIRVAEGLLVAIELADGLGEPRALAVQLLRAVGLVPDLGILELALDLREPLGASIVVKDTPSGRRGDLGAL